MAEQTPSFDRRSLLRYSAVAAVAAAVAPACRPGERPGNPWTGNGGSRRVRGKNWGQGSRVELSYPEGFDYPVLAGAPLPFVHGVASGDPLESSVVLWTRLTIPERPEDVDEVVVRWEVARDSQMRSVVRRGEARTGPDRDWTVKVDADGLRPGRAYYYQFEALGHRSPVGRTRTAGRLEDGLTIAAVACSSYWSGYFNAYRRIAENDAVDLVVHCGDHIYDFVDAEEWVRARNDRFDLGDVDFRRWNNLEENRRRYALYYSDPDFAAMHAAHPITIAWDNHDVEPGEDGSSTNSDSKRVFWEWTPCRPPVSEIVDGQLVAADVERGHRHLSYGDLDLYVLDERYLRDSVSILGEEQRTWLENELVRSADDGKRWRLVVSPLPMGFLDIGGTSIYGGWSDRAGDKAHVLDHLAANGVTGTIVVSGDAHGAFVWDLPSDQGPGGYDPATGAGSAAVEITANSVSRGGADEAIAGTQYAATYGGPPLADQERFVPFLEAAVPQSRAFEQTLVAANPSLRYANWTDHGYALIGLTPESATIESWVVPKRMPTDEQRLDASFEMAVGTTHLVRPASPE